MSYPRVDQGVVLAKTMSLSLEDKELIRAETTRSLWKIRSFSLQGEGACPWVDQSVLLARGCRQKIQKIGQTLSSKINKKYFALN
jgi:hypothetical protein